MSNRARPRTGTTTLISGGRGRRWSSPSVGTTARPGASRNRRHRHGRLPLDLLLRQQDVRQLLGRPDPKAFWLNPNSHLILVAYDISSLVRFAHGPIEYISPAVPTVKLPVYEGVRYEAVVPDTLDLAGRAALAVNGLTGPLDPMATTNSTRGRISVAIPPSCRTISATLCKSSSTKLCR